MELQAGEWVKTESGADSLKPDCVEEMTDESLQSGDWVRADSGALGQIIFASRLSAFVNVQQGASSHIATYLASELTKTDEP